MDSIRNWPRDARNVQRQGFVERPDNVPKRMTPDALSILYISYPLLTVSEEAAGGAEQVLLTLEGEMAASGHRTTVAASEGSSVNGRLLPTGEPAQLGDAYCERERHHTKRVLDYLQSHPDEFDLIHDQSGSFFRHAARCPAPVLATLHLPHSFYPDFWLKEVPSNLRFNCVSHSQAQRFVELPNAVTSRAERNCCRAVSVYGGERRLPVVAGTQSAKRKLRTWRLPPPRRPRCRSSSPGRCIRSAITSSTSSVRFGLRWAKACNS